MLAPLIKIPELKIDQNAEKRTEILILQNKE